jgi:hypothetical protein
MSKHCYLAGERQRFQDHVAVQIFGHPDDVLSDHRLSLPEKRALLASWASDANAVPGLPTLRKLPNGSIVAVAAILTALKRLDEGGSRSVYGSSARSRRGSLTIGPFEWLRSRGKGPDDDDDPPPCPAMAARPPRSGSGGAVAAVDLVAA